MAVDKMANMKSYIVLISLLSAIFYGAWGSLAELSLTAGLSPAFTGLFMFMAALILMFPLHIRFSLPDIRWIIAGVLFFAANFLLFGLMKNSSLSAAYAYVPSSIIVFFLLTSRELPAHSRARVSASMILIVVGMAIAQGLSSLRLPSLATGLSIAVLYGIAYYLTYESASKGSNTRECFWIVLTEFVLFSAVSLFQLKAVSAKAIMFPIISGVTLSFGFLLQLAAYVGPKEFQTNARLANLVNVVTNFDVVIIIIVSFLLGSYSAASIVALALVFVGASYLYIVA